MKPGHEILIPLKIRPVFTKHYVTHPNKHSNAVLYSVTCNYYMHYIPQKIHTCIWKMWFSEVETFNSLIFTIAIKSLATFSPCIITFLFPLIDFKIKGFFSYVGMYYWHTFYKSWRSTSSFALINVCLNRKWYNWYSGMVAVLQLRTDLELGWLCDVQ